MDTPSGGGCSPLFPTHRVHSHNQAHTVVERTIGLLKGRWRCLDSTGGTLSYKPEKVCTIVRACAVLHNVAQLKDVALPPVAVRLGQWLVLLCTSVWMWCFACENTGMETNSKHLFIYSFMMLCLCDARHFFTSTFISDNFFLLQPHTILWGSSIDIVRHMLPLTPTLCPPNKTAFLFSTSPTWTSTSHWVKFRFLAFLSTFAMLSVMNQY